MDINAIVSDIADVSNKYGNSIGKVVLFGSYAKGTFSDSSDLDIYIESDTMTKAQMLHSKDISDFRMTLFSVFDGKDIDFILNSPLSREYKSFEKSSLYRQIMDYGIVAYDKGR